MGLAGSAKRGSASGDRMLLYEYWRRPSAYRVRIALPLKSVDHQREPINLGQGTWPERLPPWPAPLPRP
jgi:hypothetical protein